MVKTLFISQVAMKELLDTGKTKVLPMQASLKPDGHEWEAIDKLARVSRADDPRAAVEGWNVNKAVPVNVTVSNTEWTLQKKEG